MAFMQPVYENGTFVRITDASGESWSVPKDASLPLEDGETSEEETGWFYRLSAPGYMDCTEWTGPFKTEEEAREDCRETWDVDPDTGDELPEEQPWTGRRVRGYEPDNEL